MAILTRYLIRSHVGPFLFSFGLLTGLVFLNTLALRLESLMGKGLPWRIIVEFAVLALPHTVALTLPMAVLVAVLYTFSDLTAENEITAMTAGGVNPVRLMIPLLGIGVILAGGMVLFNDRVLPEANHRLKNLLVDINRKSPTFQLREHVVNEVVASTPDRRAVYYIQTRSIDRATSEMEDVVIYDVTTPYRYRTTYARRGTMAFNEEQTDLYLTLFDGRVYEASKDPEGSFQIVSFERQLLPLRGVSDILERSGGSEYRTDREMSIAMLEEAAREKEEERREVQEESLDRSLLAVERALGVGRGAEAVTEAGALADGRNTLPAEVGLPPDGVTRGVVMALKTNAAKEESLRLAAQKYRVEIHKKYSIAVACVLFVLLGIPIALRFPRGGVGMVTLVSVAIFAFFWVFLIGGETLADRGYVHPAVAMWAPNVLLLPPGIILARRMSRQVATARAGGWDDLFATLGTLLRRPLHALRPIGGR